MPENTNRIDCIKDSDELKLGSVQKTLLLPLWGRAIETQKLKPHLVDDKAVSIINSIPYNFTLIAENINPITRLCFRTRS